MRSCHIRKVAVLYASREILVRTGEWPISSYLSFRKPNGPYIYVCAADGIHDTIEKTMRGNK